MRMLTPKKLTRTVACPSHAAVSRSQLHFAGFGLIRVGAIGCLLLHIASHQRRAVHWRTRELRKLGCRDASSNDFFRLTVCRAFGLFPPERRLCYKLVRMVLLLCDNWEFKGYAKSRPRLAILSANATLVDLDHAATNSEAETGPHAVV